jgi:hypothetical protein
MRIDLPFPSALNPQVRLLDDHLDVMARRGARKDTAGEAGESSTADRERWRAVRFERLAARMYPLAPLPLLTLSAEALVWLFDYDDYLADLPPAAATRTARRLMRSTAQVLAGELPSRPARPMGLLWDACLQARSIGGHAWWLRFSADVQDYANLQHEEALSRAEGQSPSPEAYKRLRRGTSGWALLTDLGELAEGDPLADDVASTGSCQRLRWAAGDLACAINDLLSYPKELAAQEYHNLVMVLQRSRQVSAAQAKDLVTGTIRAHLDYYHVARGEFLSWCPPAAVHYVRALEHLMRGSLDWSLESGRYPELTAGGAGRG